LRLRISLEACIPEQINHYDSGRHFIPLGTLLITVTFFHVQDVY
jgi:hypothetical protein